MFVHVRCTFSRCTRLDLTTCNNAIAFASHNSSSVPLIEKDTFKADQQSQQANWAAVATIGLTSHNSGDRTTGMCGTFTCSSLAVIHTLVSTNLLVH